MNNLTPDEQTVLEQFAEITDYNRDTEFTKVKRLLMVCNWNLEIAIARYFDNDFPELLDDNDLNSLKINDEISRSQSNSSNSNTLSNFVPHYSRSPSIPPPILNNGPLQSNFMLPFPDDTFLPKLQRAMPISNNWKFQAGLLKSTNVKNIKYKKFLTPLVFLIMLMPKVLFLIGYGLNKLLGNFAPNLFRILGLREEEDDFPSKPIYDSIEEINNYNVENYIKHKAGNLNVQLPPIFKGEFNSAYEEARNNLKWFCIILFNSQSSSSEKLVKNVLVNENFVNFIKKNDIILYVGDVSYPEPFEVGKSYNAFGIPYLSLVANISVTGLTHPEFSIVTKYNKILNHLKNDSFNSKALSKVIKRLERIIVKYEPQLVSQRYDKQETDFSRLLREQQDTAYQESLLKDKEREEERKSKLEQENLIKSKQLEEVEKLKLKELKRKEYIIKFINKTYTRDSSNWEKTEFTNIQFRTENGQRFINKFHKDDTTKDVFMYVLSKQMIDDIIHNGIADNINDDSDEEQFVFENEDDVLEYLQDYKFQFNEAALNDENITSFPFDLVSPMPRLRLKPGFTNLDQIKEIWPNGSLLVEKIEEGSEDEAEEHDEE
jgi:UBX domain-containing protein 2